MRLWILKIICRLLLREKDIAKPCRAEFPINNESLLESALRWREAYYRESMRIAQAQEIMRSSHSHGKFADDMEDVLAWRLPSHPDYKCNKYL